MERKEAIEVIKKNWPDSSFTMLREALETLIPELIETEDEKIRKIISDILLIDSDEIREILDTNNVLIQDVYAWFEKQGKQKPINSQFTPEQAGVLDKHIDKFIEQKPADKIEPKFKVGDWIVSNLDKKARQISEVHFDEYNSYYVVDGKSVNLEEYDRLHHLWALTDAKDGDVLVCPKYAGDIIPNIFIFKNIEIKDNDVFCYCSFLEKFRTESYVANADPINTDFYPATKEQRDTLIKAMTDAGYTFDFNKKELKKIEQTLAYKVEPKFKKGDIIKEKETGNLFYVNTVEDFGYTLHYKNYIEKGCVMSFKYEDNYELVEHTPAWSEEDEINLKKAIWYVENPAPMVVKDSMLVEWLKSLRPQSQWKPSDEQIEALDNARHSNPFNVHVLDTLFHDLKKLREE